MTDSTDTTTHDDFVSSLIADRDAFQAEQERIEAEHEAAKSIARGALTQAIFQADLDVDDLNKIEAFIEADCEFEQVVIAAGNSDDSAELKAKLAQLERDNAELLTENERLAHFDGELILTFKDENEFRKAQQILQACVNGGGKFIDPRRVENALKPQEQKREQKGASGPPTAEQSSKADKPEKKSLADKILGK